MLNIKFPTHKVERSELLPYIDSSWDLRKQISIKEYFYGVMDIQKEKQPSGEGNFGYRVPFKPEAAQVIAQILSSSLGAVWVDFGGSDGLFAFTVSAMLPPGVQVVVNDVSTLCKEQFDLLKGALTEPAIRDKVRFDLGSADAFLERNPGLANNVTLVTCFNMGHFLGKERLDRVNAAAQRSLKPDGRFLFSGTAWYGQAPAMTYLENNGTPHPKEGDAVFMRMGKYKENGVEMAVVCRARLLPNTHPDIGRWGDSWQSIRGETGQWLDIIDVDKNLTSSKESQADAADMKRMLEKKGITTFKVEDSAMRVFNVATLKEAAKPYFTAESVKYCDREGSLTKDPDKAVEVIGIFKKST